MEAGEECAVQGQTASGRMMVRKAQRRQLGRRAHPWSRRHGRTSFTASGISDPKSRQERNTPDVFQAIDLSPMSEDAARKKMTVKDHVQIQLAAGPIRAARDGDLVRARGIRYGHADRFQPPRPLAPGSETVDCTQKGPICPQQKFPFEAVIGPVDEGGRPHSEDCLTLTVTAPANAHPDEKRPVIVWFHGGAYFFGAGDLDIFDPAGLVRRGAVGVNVTYRLGILGYQPVLGVIEANNGLLDQILALKWVQHNISVFGGDPGNVTLMGQSAGGDSVFCLSVADGTEGLFHHAIISSAPFGLKKNRQPMNDGLMQIASTTLASAAVEMSVEELMAVQDTVRAKARKHPKGGLPFAPWFGKYPMPDEHDAEARFFAAAKRINYLIGWTQEDALPFVNMIPIGAMLGRIPWIGNMLKRGIARLATNLIWKWPALQLCRKVEQAGGRAATFCFEWSPPGSPFQACHCIDMPFYVGDWSVWSRSPMCQGPGAQQVFERVGGEVKDLWVAFAKGDVEPRGHLRITEHGILNSAVSKKHQ